ncbi:MAG TPA: lysine--tRNA ligase [Pirellulales bacterium]|jgi:lysyl-tRNA synthetase class 2|nr:lysine--tRNA ligase [Pirellulales bacterium]
MTSDSPQADHGDTHAMLVAARREKIRRLEGFGIDPWGSRFDGHQSIGEIRRRESEIVVSPPPPGTEGRQGEQHGPRVRAAGRIVLMRDTGKLIFLDIRDWSGQVQLYIGKKQVGDANWAVAQCFDLGDIIGVDGELKHTQKGELTIFADGLHFLTKSLEPPPDKHHGLTDPELRQRMRYLDLIHGEGVLRRFLDRTKIVQSIRKTLTGEGFVEIEGPTLHSIAGGAAARPFITHHNALDLKLYLRIALELHLKRLMVGGMERVYELGRVYRNEGISPRHNPEFTMLELYQAYGDYRSMMDLTERVIVEAIRATGQALKLPWGEKTIDFTPPFARRTYDELFADVTGVAASDQAAVRALAEQIGFNTADKHPDVIKSEVFEERVEDQLSGPIFVMDYPASICPLTKRKRDNPAVAERFELYVQGMEIANAYTELNDPDLQEHLFRTQLQGLAAEESMAKMDHDFVRALRHGMPPAGGLGIGIDRLIMLLTNSQTIRDVILFPLLRPET